MRRGEIELRFKLFRPNAVNTIEFLFKIPIPSKFTMRETKEEVVRHFEELQKNDATKRKVEPFSLGKPESLRLREVFITAPATILCDTQLVKDAFANKAFVHAPEVLVQMLPEGETETKTSNDHIVFFLQQFHPDKFELGPKFEFLTSDAEKLGSLVQRIKTHSGINTISLHSCDNWDDAKLLSIPEAKWTDITDEPTEGRNDSKKYDPNRTVLSWRIADGDLYLFKDFTAPLKELTEEEKTRIKEDDEKKRKARMAGRVSYHSSREESLIIKQKDVGIDDV